MSVTQAELDATYVPFPGATYLGAFDLTTGTLATWLQATRPGLLLDIAKSCSMPGGAMRGLEGQPLPVSCYSDGVGRRSAFVFPQGFGSSFADRSCNSTRQQLVIDGTPERLQTSVRPWGAACNLTAEDLRQPFWADGRLLAKLLAAATCPSEIAGQQAVLLTPVISPASGATLSDKLVNRADWQFSKAAPFMIVCDTAYGPVTLDAQDILMARETFWKESGPPTILTAEYLSELFQILRNQAR